MRYGNSDLNTRINHFLDRYQDEIVEAFILHYSEEYEQYLDDRQAETNWETEMAYAYNHKSWPDFAYEYATDACEDEESFDEDNEAIYS